MPNRHIGKRGRVDDDTPTPDLNVRVYNYIQWLSNQCKTCMRRNTHACNHCPILTARGLYDEMKGVGGFNKSLGIGGSRDEKRAFRDLLKTRILDLFKDREWVRSGDIVDLGLELGATRGQISYTLGGIKKEHRGHNRYREYKLIGTIEEQMPKCSS